MVASGGVKEVREKKGVKVKHLKDKDGVKGRAKVKGMKEPGRKLKRKKVSVEEKTGVGVGEGATMSGGVTAVEGEETSVKKIKLEPGAGVKAIKKKFKRKDKVQIKVNKDGIEARHGE